MKSSMDVCDMVQALADIVQKHGQYDFSYCEKEDDVRAAMLCGLTVLIENGYIVRISARDMDIVLNSYFHRAANDEQVVSLASYTHYSFLKGDSAELESWLARLTRFQSVFHRPERKNLAGQKSG